MIPVFVLVQSCLLCDVLTMCNIFSCLAHRESCMVSRMRRRAQRKTQRRNAPSVCLYWRKERTSGKVFVHVCLHRFVGQNFEKDAIRLSVAVSLHLCSCSFLSDYLSHYSVCCFLYFSVFLFVAITLSDTICLSLVIHFFLCFLRYHFLFVALSLYLSVSLCILSVFLSVCPHFSLLLLCLLPPCLSLSLCFLSVTFSAYCLSSYLFL